jgi:hypothetical protein
MEEQYIVEAVGPTDYHALQDVLKAKINVLERVCFLLTRQELKRLEKEKDELIAQFRDSFDPEEARRTSRSRAKEVFGKIVRKSSEIAKLSTVNDNVLDRIKSRKVYLFSDKVKCTHDTPETTCPECFKERQSQRLLLIREATDDNLKRTLESALKDMQIKYLKSYLKAKAATVASESLTPCTQASFCAVLRVSVCGQLQGSTFHYQLNDSEKAELLDELHTSVFKEGGVTCIMCGMVLVLEKFAGMNGMSIDRGQTRLFMDEGDQIVNRLCQFCNT